MTITQRIYHSKTYKAIGGGLAALVMMTVTTGIAHADFTDTRKVSIAWQYANSDGYVYLEGDDNQCAQNYYIIAQSGAEHEMLMRMVTDALLWGKAVKFGYSFVDGYCYVSSVKIHR